MRPGAAELRRFSLKFMYSFNSTQIFSFMSFVCTVMFPAMNIQAKDDTKPTKPRALHDLVDQPPIRIRYSPGTGEDLVISFSSIGRRRAEMPPDEFLGTVLSNTSRHALFISDLSRSWLNNKEFRKKLESTVQTVIRETGATRVTTLGLSLGAFSALAASSLFPVHAALAISPQFSMMPGAIKGERRWHYWRKQIKAFEVETAEVAPPPAQSFLFHGMIDDQAHMQAFTQREGLDQFAFPGQSHSSLGRHLRDAAVLPGLLSAAIAHDRRGVARLAKSCGGQWRNSVAHPSSQK